MQELLIKHLLSVLFSLVRDVGIFQGTEQPVRFHLHLTSNNIYLRLVTTNRPIGVMSIVVNFIGEVLGRFVATVLIVVDGIGSILFGLTRHSRVVEGAVNSFSILQVS